MHTYKEGLTCRIFSTRIWAKPKLDANLQQSNKKDSIFS